MAPPSWTNQLLRFSAYRVGAGASFWLGALLYFQNTPAAIRWPVRLLWIAITLWLLYGGVSLCKRVKFTTKKTFFVALMLGFNWLCLMLLCLVFNAVMAQKDDRLTARGLTSLPPDCRRGIESLLAGKSMAHFSKELGWQPRPGYKSESYTVSHQGVRSTKEYPLPAVDPEKRFLCMGDSFTFGTAVTDVETYPAQAEALVPGSEWINCGMPATCLTQSYLRYLIEGPKFGGKHVIIGFMSNDAQRTVNCFRPFVNPDSGAPLTKPFAKYEAGKFTIEPNPYSSLEDYKRLLTDESTELAHLRRIDYLTWSGEMTSLNPVLRTFAYVYDARGVDQNLNSLLGPHQPLGRWIKSLLPEDVYGRAIYDKRSKGFHALTAMFARYHEQVVADGRTPLFVIFPGPLDVEAHQKKQRRQYASLIDFLNSKGYRYLDFLVPLVARHPRSLAYSALFVNNHYQGQVNKEVAEEVIKAIQK